MTGAGASTNPKKLTLKMKVHPNLFVLNLATIGAFWQFWILSELFLELGSGSKTFLGPTYVNNQLWFLEVQPYLLFLILPLLCFLGPSGLFFSPFGTTFAVEIRFKTHFWSLLM